MDASAALDFLAGEITPAFHPSFRGSVIEYAEQVNLQGHYSVKGQLDLATLKHLHGPLEAFQDPMVRVITIQGAVQTTKSLVLDLMLLYIIEHNPGDTIWYLETDPKAKQYAEERVMPLIYGKPEIATMLEGIDRDDKTKTKIKFRHMTFQICGLNLTNTQTLSWQNVFVDEAWAARRNGLIRHAMDRTKQYPDTHKIVLVGQGGWEDDDFDKEHKKTDQQILEYACPQCGHYQPFALSRLRGEDHPVERLRGTYAGLSWDTNDSTRPNGRWDFEKVGKTGHHRCYLCDFRIEDAPDVRRKLNDSYRYRVTNPGAEASKRGFQWPGEASMRVKFFDLTVKYLRAKVAMDELAYNLQMEEYYQKDRGLTWSENCESDHKALAQADYDVRSDWEAEARRFLIVDCQGGQVKFHLGVFSVAADGETRELARDTVSTFEEVARIQLDWKVRDECVFVDVGHDMPNLCRACYAHGHEANVRIGKRVVKIWRSWVGLKGSGQESFTHEVKKWDKVLRREVIVCREQRIYSPKKWYQIKDQTSGRVVRVLYYEFSNLHCKDLLRARRDGEPNAPKFHFLPDTLPPNDPQSFFAQMHSERREERPGGRPIWVNIGGKNNPRPNHRWDIGQMLMAAQTIFGIIGGATIPAAEEAPQEASAPA